MSYPPVVIIPQADLRRMFNDMGLWSLAQQGKLHQITIYNVPCRARLGEPKGTRSQIVWYYDQGRKVALVHQYLRPDGSVGASGQPDPKRVMKDGVIYTCLTC